MNPRNSELVLNSGGFHQRFHWLVDRAIQVKGTAYVARLFIGFLSESERESVFNPLRRTVNEAKEIQKRTISLQVTGTRL